MKTGPNVTRGIPSSINKIHHYKRIAICTIIYLGKRSLALLNTFKTLDKVAGISLDNMITDDMSKFMTYWHTSITSKSLARASNSKKSF